MTPSEQELFPTKELENVQEIETPEPLINISDVLGWEAPEKVQDTIPEEIQAAKQLKEDRDPYQVWQAEPTQQNLYNVVKTFQPTMQSVLSSMGNNDPNVRSKARIITAKAIQTFDPQSGASLPTWVSQNLRQLTRDIRKSGNVFQIPEGIQLDAFNLHKAELELQDELNREPTVQELADKAHLSIKRIKDIRAKNKATVSDASFTQDDGTVAINGQNTDYTQDALDYIYNDADLTDKKLLEYVMGYGGSDILDNKAIMQKLKLTPVQLTRRKMRLGMKVREITDALEQV